MVGITVFNDVILPAKVMAAAGLRGKQTKRNTRVQSQNGRQQVNGNWSNTLRQYETGFIALHPKVWQTLEGIFEVTYAGVFGFLLEDPKDGLVETGYGFLYPYIGGDVIGAIGVGYGVPTLRLYKRYVSVGSTRTSDRSITRPQLTPVLLRGAAVVVLGAGAGNAAINYDTGTVTFVADSSSAVTAVTVGATTQVTLAAALSGLAVGGRLYLLGLTGADAALLNGLSHAVTAITGGGLNVYTLSTNTTGKTITATGTGYKYPQATETLTWTGRFYVPVHFANDDIDWDFKRPSSAEAGRLVAGPSVVLEEVRE